MPSIHELVSGIYSEEYHINLTRCEEYTAFSDSEDVDASISYFMEVFDVEANSILKIKVKNMTELKERLRKILDDGEVPDELASRFFAIYIKLKKEGV